jgi:hypothetical protein
MEGKKQRQKAKKERKKGRRKEGEVWIKVKGIMYKYSFASH